MAAFHLPRKKLGGVKQLKEKRYQKGKSPLNIKLEKEKKDIFFLTMKKKKVGQNELNLSSLNKSKSNYNLQNTIYPLSWKAQQFSICIVIK